MNISRGGKEVVEGPGTEGNRGYNSKSHTREGYIRLKSRPICGVKVKRVSSCKQIHAFYLVPIKEYYLAGKESKVSKPFDLACSYTN
jgi:hypothetical protein